MKQWIINSTYDDVADLACEVSMPSLLVKLLARRGLGNQEQIQRFLEPDESQFYDPFLMKDMTEAVVRFKKALKQQEKILVFGDYDVDGVASVAILAKYLNSCNADYITMLPERHVHGYDFSEHALEKAISENVSLVMCLDCGSNSSVLRTVPNKGIDVIVIDHHEVTDEDINFLLVNPKRQDCQYPFRDLTTGALIFKFLSAIEGRPAYESIDLAGLSVVCDVAPLLDENRLIVKKGIEKMRTSPCLGLEVLMNVTNVKVPYVDTFHMGWKLGPRLNATGRISRADLSLDLLMADDYQIAKNIAFEIEGVNKQRKTISDQVRELAMEQVEARKEENDYVHILYGNDWNAGIVGIVASNVKEKYYRPAIVISFDGEKGKGSGRSIHGFNILDALTHCKDLLINFGGHERACGVEINQNNIELFRNKINKYAKQRLESEDLVPVLYVDAEISFFDITDALAQSISLFAPFGEANRDPVFATNSVVIKNITDSMYGQKQVWFEETSVKGSRMFSARIYRNNPILENIQKGKICDIVYSVSYDSRNPAAPVNLKLKDIH